MPASDSTATLVREALTEVGALVRSEIALARDEVQREARGFATGAIAFAAAGAALTLGITFLIVAFALAIFPHPLAALVIGIVLVVVAVVAALVGYAALPRKPLSVTRERLGNDARLIKEQFA